MKVKDRIFMALPNFAKRSHYDLVIPNFFHGRYEMDLFKLTDSGLITEYEVKVSRSDFLRDAKKSHDVYDFSSGNIYGVGKKNKHEQLQSGDGTPNRFYFVVPEGMLKDGECPKFAGLLEFCEEGWFRQVKTAPLLHKRTVPQSVYKDISVKLAFREAMYRNMHKSLDSFLKHNYFSMDNFKVKVFAKALKKKRTENILTLRQASAAIGISTSTLNRLENEKIPDVYSYFYCCKWLGVDMGTFFKKYRVKDEEAANTVNGATKG